MTDSRRKLNDPVVCPEGSERSRNPVVCPEGSDRPRNPVVCPPIDAPLVVGIKGRARTSGGGAQPENDGKEHLESPDERITARLFGGPPAASGEWSTTEIPEARFSASRSMPAVPKTERPQSFAAKPDPERRLLEVALQGGGAREPALEPSRDAQTILGKRARSEPKAGERIGRLVVLPALRRSASIALWAMAGFVLVSFGGLWASRLIENEAISAVAVSAALPAAEPRPREDPRGPSSLPAASARFEWRVAVEGPVVAGFQGPNSEELATGAPPAKLPPEPAASAGVRRARAELPGSGLVTGAREPAPGESVSPPAREPAVPMPAKEAAAPQHDFTRPMAPLVD